MIPENRSGLESRLNLIFELINKFTVRVLPLGRGEVLRQPALQLPDLVLEILDRVA